jgi:hypothetical protein
MRRFEHSSGGGHRGSRAGQFEDVAFAQDFVAGRDHYFRIGAADRDYHRAAVGVKIKFGKSFVYTLAVGAQRHRRDNPDAGDCVRTFFGPATRAIAED